MSERTQIGWKRRVRRMLSRRLRPVEAWLRKHFLLALDRLIVLTPAAPKSDRVLIVRLDNIGDFVVWLDAGKAIAEHYQAQGKSVTLLANAIWKKWATDFGIFDEVIALEERRFRRDIRYRFEMSRKIRQMGFGTVVQPAYTRILEGADSVVRISGARDRVGQSGTFDQGFEGNRETSNPWYTKLLSIDAEIASEMQRNAAFTRALIGMEYKARVADLNAHLRLTMPDDLAAELDGRAYFVVFPGASFAGRLWPADRYLTLARRVHAETGWVGIVCGAPSEAVQAAWMCGETDSPLVNWVERTNLTQLAAVIAHAELLIGNETSAVHIAAAAGTPSVCIVGGGHYGRFMPYSVEEADERPLPVAAVAGMACFHCGWRCIYHPPKGTPVPCIEEVTVDAAWRAVEECVPEKLSKLNARVSANEAQPFTILCELR